MTDDIIIREAQRIAADECRRTMALTGEMDIDTITAAVRLGVSHLWSTQKESILKRLMKGQFRGSVVTDKVLTKRLDKLTPQIRTIVASAVKTEITQMKASEIASRAAEAQLRILFKEMGITAYKFHTHHPTGLQVTVDLLPYKGVWFYIEFDKMNQKIKDVKPGLEHLIQGVELLGRGIILK